MNKRIKEAMRGGQKFSQKDLCKFSTAHDGYCYKTKNNYGVAVAEEHLLATIGKHLLVDEDGNYLGDDQAIFAGRISSDNDTKSPQRMMRAQNELIGHAADGKAKHVADKNHIVKNFGNEVYAFRGKDKTVGSGVSGLSNERISMIKADMSKILDFYQPLIGDESAKKKTLELVRALVKHHCGDHSLCKHEDFCTHLRVKNANPGLSAAEVDAKAASESMRSHQLSLDSVGQHQLLAILLKRFGERSIDNSAAGGCSNASENFWMGLTKYTEGKRLNVDHSDLWTVINRLVFIRMGEGNAAKTHQELSDQLSLPVTGVSRNFRTKADKKRASDQSRARSDAAKQSRVINKITKQARMGKEDAKSHRYKTEKVKLSVSQSSSLATSRPRKKATCSLCGQTGHSKRTCKMPPAHKKRGADQLCNCDIAELDLLEDCLGSGSKRLKTINFDDLDFSDLLNT